MIIGIIKKYWVILVVMLLLILVLNPKEASFIRSAGWSSSKTLIAPDVIPIGYESEIYYVSGEDEHLSSSISNNAEISYAVFLNDNPQPLGRFTDSTCPQASGHEVCIFISKIDGSRFIEGKNKIKMVWYYNGKNQDNIPFEACINSPNGQNAFNKFMAGQSLDWNTDCGGIAPITNLEWSNYQLRGFGRNSFIYPNGAIITKEITAMPKTQYETLIKTETIEKVVYQDKIVYVYKNSITEWFNNLIDWIKSLFN
jgi:hypothetical protein